MFFNFLLFIFLFIKIIKNINAQYEDEYTINARAGIINKLFDGDIDLRPEEYLQLKRSKFFSDPAARKTALFTNWVTDEKYLWPSKPSTTPGVRYGPVINYTLDWEKIVEPPSFVWLKNILDAHKNIEENTCIRFANSSEGDHIHYYWGYGCHSLVGRNGGKQWLSLGPGCWTVNAVHETLHALGSNHEQSRQDRDSFIKINEKNMIDNISDAFAIVEGSPTGNPYDFGSTMHYNNMAFSKNKKSTIETIDKNYQHTIGYRLKLSFLDTKALNHRYCEHICDDNTWIPPDCRNKGYPNPNKCTECLCPEGYAPPYCDQVEKGQMQGEGESPLYAECPGESNILLTPDFPLVDETRWYNASKFTCYWKIQAPADYYIGVELKNIEGFKCEQSCYSFIEIKYGNMANSGPRFCCDLPTETLYTEVQGHEVIIITRGYKPGNHSVTLSYSITK